MEFDPYSEPRSMGVNTLNQYLGNTRHIFRSPSGPFEDRGHSPDLDVREYPQNMVSATVSPDMAFQNRRVDENSDFVDFQVPGAARQSAVRTWLQGLPDPLRLDPQEIYVSCTGLQSQVFGLNCRFTTSICPEDIPSEKPLTMFDLPKGPIVGREDEPIDSSSGPEGARPAPPTASQPDAQGRATLIIPDLHQGNLDRFVGEPASPRLTPTQAHARPALVESSEVRNRVVQNLRDVSGTLPRDAEDGPQVPEDAPHIGSPLEGQILPPGEPIPAQRPQFAGTLISIWAEWPMD